MLKIFAPGPLAPSVKPRSVLVLPAVTTMPEAAELTATVEGSLLRAGSASLCGGTVTPAMAASVVLAPCPMTFWLLRSVSAAVSV